MTVYDNWLYPPGPDPDEADYYECPGDVSVEV
jgi:hypothetical protein